MALLRGSRAGWRTLVGYGVVGLLWCAAKPVFWHEAQSLVFGAANVLFMLLLAAPATRARVR